MTGEKDTCGIPPNPPNSHNIKSASFCFQQWTQPSSFSMCFNSQHGSMFAVFRGYRTWTHLKISGFKLLAVINCFVSAVAISGNAVNFIVTCDSFISSSPRNKKTQTSVKALPQIYQKMQLLLVYLMLSQLNPAWGVNYCLFFNFSTSLKFYELLLV